MKTYVGRGVGAYFIDDLLLAEDYVYIISRWISPKYMQPLIRRAKKGVEVKIITSNDEEKNHQYSLKILRKELKPPTKFGLFRDKSWIPPNMETLIIDKEYLHVKLYIFDDKMAVVGSANMTESGMYRNIEYILMGETEEEIETIKNDFHKLWKLYEESKIEVEEIFTLDDIAEKLGITLSKLKGLMRRR